MRKLPRIVPLIASALAVAGLTACVAPAPYQTTRYPYQPQAVYPAQQQGVYTEYGRVANIEVLRTERPGTGTGGAGAVAGGVIGGVLGHQVGSGNGRTAATALGIVGGALLGNGIEAQNNGPRVYESYRVSIQTDNGAFRAYDVPHPGDLRIGDRVRIDNGQISRM